MVKKMWELLWIMEMLAVDDLELMNSLSDTLSDADLSYFDLLTLSKWTKATEVLLLWLLAAACCFNMNAASATALKLLALLLPKLSLLLQWLLLSWMLTLQYRVYVAVWTG